MKRGGVEEHTSLEILCFEVETHVGVLASGTPKQTVFKAYGGHRYITNNPIFGLSQIEIIYGREYEVWQTPSVAPDEKTNAG